MNQTAHTSSAFERDLVELNEALVRLGMLASKQLNGSLRAMSDFQEKRVKMLIDRDRELDELEAEINGGSATTPAMSANAPGRSWRASRGSCRGTR